MLGTARPLVADFGTFSADRPERRFGGQFRPLPLLEPFRHVPVDDEQIKFAFGHGGTSAPALTRLLIRTAIVLGGLVFDSSKATR